MVVEGDVYVDFHNIVIYKLISTLIYIHVRKPHRALYILVKLRPTHGVTSCNLQPKALCQTAL